MSKQPSGNNNISNEFKTEGALRGVKPKMNIKRLPILQKATVASSS